MAKLSRNSMSNIFLLVLLIFFFMLLYVYARKHSLSKELFIDSSSEQKKLIPADKLVVVQGNGIPDLPLEPTLPDSSDTSAVSVDGTEEGPKSKFLFAYNECKPSCCATSGGYACNGGCPCITKDQQKFAFSRGYNLSSSKKCQFFED
jgi:hypothetical protein